MKRVLLLLALLCLAACACAAEGGVDARMAQLSVLSQRDEAIAELTYNTATVRQRGCMPVSVANGLIASFGVTDRETAAGLVRETIALLVPRGSRGKAPVDLLSMPGLLDPARRISERETYPNLADTVGAYPGGMAYMEKRMHAQEALERIDAAQAPFLLAGRLYVHPDWTDAVQIMMGLHDRGMDDATLCIACVGAGRKTSGAPLRSGSNGHYVSIFFHVGSFMEEGTAYVLDSLPRAIADEPYGLSSEMHVRYAFRDDRQTNAFNTHFYAARISPTVIRLSLKPEALAALRAEPKETELERRVKLMKPLVLFGGGVAMISLPEAAEK